MWIVRLALRRPYTFIVASLLLLLMSPMVLLRTATDVFPNINIPVVSIIWAYQGLSAQEIEQRIVLIHERALSATVNDIEHIESQSLSGIGIIKIFFQPGVSVDAAVAQATAVSQTVLRQMPPGITPPLVIRYSASSVPILQLGLSSSKLSEQELYDYALNNVRVGLATVGGASIPFPYGGKVRQIMVDLNMRALQAKNLSPIDVVNAINAQNIISPAGTTKIGLTEYNVELNTSPKALEELNDLPVKAVNGAVIYVRDVAHVHDGFTPQQNMVRQDGHRGVLLTIFKNGAASTLDIVASIRQTLPRILASLPPELKIQPLADQSLFVRAAVNGVFREGIIAAALTALMILLFLGSWRSTLIIALSIPLSVLASLAILSALGETINLMTLGGLALAVGILVDDATVTIENIERRLGDGGTLEDGIMAGAGEIAMPAFVSTLCICIVFVPMFFLTGVAKYLFVPLAEAVVFAMLASYVLSRTLVPTLVMYFFRHQHGAAGKPSNSVFVRFQKRFEAGFERFRDRYQTWLRVCMEHRMALALAFIIFCGGSWLLVLQLGQDFFPQVDAGQMKLHLRARTGTRIEETAKLTDQVEQAIRQEIPAAELVGILDNIGIPNSGISLSYSTSGLIGSGDADILVSLGGHHAPTEEYIRRLRRALPKQFPGTLFYFLPADIVSQTLNFGLPAPFDIQFVGKNLDKNREVAGRLAERIRRIPGAVDVRVQQPFDQPKLRFEVDRTKALQVGLTERQVANSVLLTLSGSGQVQPAYWLNPANGINYLVAAQAPQYDMSSLDSIANIPITADGSTNGSQLVANLVTVSRSAGMPVVSHYNVQPVIDVFGGVSGRDLGGVLHEIEPLVEAAKKELPRGSWMVLRGQAETMRTSYNGLATGLVLAIVLVYLLLVVNFQSWSDPFIIITALPGALAGVLWMLLLTQTTLSVPALMGAIMSIGVATANSVLVVAFARENLQRGLEPMRAALEAGVGRLRPVLMTAMAMVIGMVPMALGLGEGGEQNAPLGRAVIGGLTLATIATLFFVPVVFSIVHRRKHTVSQPVQFTPAAHGSTT
ncbi:MAG: cation/multidrug efflux pump [Pedosphaera sp.]|nr:cation/multidrug efflux pump [Pedosphaera sp.]